MPEVTLQEMVACIDREVAFRAKVFPRWVNAQPPKMTAKTAEVEQARMRAVRARLIRSAAIEAVFRGLAQECGWSDAEQAEAIEGGVADLAKQFPVPA